MNSNETKKKIYKKPKHKTQLTTNPETSVKPRNVEPDETHKCSLLAAKDSEWVDILQTPEQDVPRSSSNVSEEEEVLQLVECEERPAMRPLAIMFPGLLEKDPQTLQGVLNKVMSTTEVTKHLVDLGQKANFTFMKKSTKLIPRDKKWLESLAENNNSVGSVESSQHSNLSISYEADNEISECENNRPKSAKKENDALNTIEHTNVSQKEPPVHSK